MRIGLQALFSIASMALLIWFLANDDFYEKVTKIHWSTIVGAFALTMFQAAATALRWDLILKNYSIHFPLVTVFRVQLASLFASLFLPSSVGTGVGKLILLVKAASPVKILESVILDKVFALLALALLCTISIGYIFITHPESTAIFYQQWIIAVILVGLVLGVILWRKGQRYLSGMARIFNVIPTLSLPALLHISLISLLAPLLTICVYILVASHLAPELQPWKFLLLLPTVMMVSALPISFNGWGVREAASVVVFGLIGMDEPQALAISVQVGVLSIIPSLVGAFCWYKLPARPDGSSGNPATD
ncbi:uncharacterized protein (TIRG00374 family) [Aestuariispira insulae]|uniref:Uncharacterized protein (TIRG00374 family) n=1 Tax=Aestuariispira insulae TaxID=1461337 RepID=A0A3D9HK19_9PROT|nr:uncharacterized protein (TIRG00374 family) [Aestuariispira insulae]